MRMLLGDFATQAPDILAWLGPCIGPREFEVGRDVYDAFVRVDGAARQHFQPSATTPGKFLADLAGLARQRLLAAGVDHIFGNDSSTAWCTVRNPERFYSHRLAQRSGLQATGRMAACVWLS